MIKVIMLIGLPGSGKSSYAKEYLKRIEHPNSWKICSSDLVRKTIYGDESIQGNANTVFEHLHKDVRNAILNNFNVIYDATNLTRKNRKTLVQFCRQYKAVKDIQLEAHIVWASIDECISRDFNRNRTVGENVITKFVKRFEIPDLEEGFDHIHVEFNSDIDPHDYLVNLIRDMHISQDNSHHTLTVYKHCEKACDYLSFEGYLLRQAALLHDIGKPFCKTYKRGDSNAHYYNHDNVGAYQVIPILKCPEYVEYFTEQELLLIIWLINNHMQPYFNSKYYHNLSGNKKEKLDKLHRADKEAH